MCTALGYGAAPRGAPGPVRYRVRRRGGRAAGTGGRADLLARLAGLAEGFGRDEPGQETALTVAALARDAGADPDEIPGWIAIGRERRVTANLPPFPGGRRGG